MSLFREVFLPFNYPHSVSSDYLDYQIWDSVQAFASSMNGALATQAILKGVGVGNEQATALAATLTWLLKDGSGMVGRILFAWRKAKDLDTYSKSWRLMADILNDIAFFLDISSVFITYYPFFFISICTSSVLRSIVGVAGGVTRTVVVQHQSIDNNIADVAAKDGSQETCVNLLSLIASLILLPLIHQNQYLIFVCFLIFTFAHLYANYKAVRALNFNVFNYETFHLAVKHYLNNESLDVNSINKKEPLFSSNLIKNPKSLAYETDNYLIQDNIITIYDSTSAISSFEAQFMYESHSITSKLSTDFQNFFHELESNGWNLGRHNFNHTVKSKHH
uniref:UPF0420 protein C16orf58-like protein n=1 Tax=Rhabditophanes sp. KR3021 TaxID=114890 RepID=A0AC35UDB0_9BILA